MKRRRAVTVVRVKLFREIIQLQRLCGGFCEQALDKANSPPAMLSSETISAWSRNTDWRSSHNRTATRLPKLTWHFRNQQS
jgi:hypothetical protein